MNKKSIRNADDIPKTSFQNRVFHKNIRKDSRKDFRPLGSSSRGNYRGTNRIRGRYNDRNYNPNYRNFNSPSPNYHQQFRSRPHERPQKVSSRPVSPVEGSEEYMKRKIQQTSAIIMRHLLTPDDNILDVEKSKRSKESSTNKKNTLDNSNNSTKTTESKEKVVNRSSSSSKTRYSDQYNVEEIYDKIMNHITNLNDGRKRNLINSSESGYDVVIQQIQKQKRLEITRALRDMCSTKTQESTDFINSIIPDVGIKIEDIPVDLIEELRNTLNLDFEEHFQGEDITTNSKQLQFEFPEPQESLDNLQPFGKEVRKSLDLDFDEHCQGKNLGENVTTKQVQFECSETEESRDNLQPFGNTTLGTPALSECGSHVEATEFKDNFENKDHDLCQPNINNSSEVKIKQEVIDTQSEHESFCDYTNTSTNINLNDNVTSEVSDGSFTNNIKQEIIDDVHVMPSDVEDFFDQTINSTVESNLVVTEGIYQNNYFPALDNRQNESIAYSEDINSALKNTEIIPKNVADNMTKTIVKQFKDQSANTNKLCVNFNMFLEHFIAKGYDSYSTTEVLQKISCIDKYIEELTKHRQSLWNHVVRRHKLHSHIISPRQKIKEKALKKKIKEKDKHKKEKDLKKTNRTQTSKTTTNSNLTLVSTPEDKRVNKKRKADSDTTPKRKRKKKSKDNKEEEEKKNSENTDSDTTPKRKRRKKSKDKEEEEKKDSEKTQSVEIIVKEEETLSSENTHSVEITVQDIIGNVAADVKSEELLEFREASPLESIEIKDDACEVKQYPSLQLPEVKEKVLVIKHIKDQIVAATENGKIYFCHSHTGQLIHTLNVHTVPITSIVFIESDNLTNMYVGSFLNCLKIYNLESKSLINSISAEDSIQCMEDKWGCIFMGCRTGMLLRFSIKKEKFEFAERLSSDAAILVVKATHEGSRRILLIGSRNCPVLIRDAMSGLYMRTLDNVISPTVYSLLLNNNLVYCGTTSHNILVFSFHEGKLVTKLSSKSEVDRHSAVGCLRIVKNLLFASCHNGNIYVYNIKSNEYIGLIPGPGGIILSLEVLHNQVILGTMTFYFMAIPIPEHILRHCQQ